MSTFPDPRAIEDATRIVLQEKDGSRRTIKTANNTVLGAVIIVDGDKFYRFTQKTSFFNWVEVYDLKVSL